MTDNDTDVIKGFEDAFGKESTYIPTETEDPIMETTLPEGAEDYEFEAWLSTDGKHSVHFKAIGKEQRREAMHKAIEVYEYILTRYGTKQAQAVKEYKNGGDKPAVDPETCTHVNFKFVQSHTEKNPGKWFKMCTDCQKFLGWQ